MCFIMEFLFNLSVLTLRPSGIISAQARQVDKESRWMRQYSLDTAWVKSGLVYAMGNHDFRNGSLEGARVEIGSLLFRYSLTDKVFSQGSWRGSTNRRGLGSFNSSSHFHDARKKAQRQQRSFSCWFRVACCRCQLMVLIGCEAVRRLMPGTVKRYPKSSEE